VYPTATALPCRPAIDDDALAPRSPLQRASCSVRSPPVVWIASRDLALRWHDATATIRPEYSHDLDPKPTRLRVSGNIGTPAPAMTIVRRGDSEPSSVNCVDGAWTKDLDAGDYLIEIQVEVGKWLAGPLNIVTELTPGQSQPAFVHYGPLSQSPEPVGLTAWEAKPLTIDPPKLSLTDDPKDPWPPPPPPPLRVTLAPVSAEWFTDKLRAARARVEPQLSGGGGKGAPASASDDSITGS
jgi:hypothetical protein